MAMTENAANIALCNQSLGLLGAKVIVLDGTTLNHTYCTAYFDDARDEILASHKWNFAKKRAFAIQTATPFFGYDNAFTKPTDSIKIWRIDDDNDAKWEREGDLIVTDRGDAAPDWADETDYLVGQYVSNDDITYLCIVAHTSGDEDDEPGVGADTATYWTSQSGDYTILPVEYVYQHVTLASWPIYTRTCAVYNLAIKLCSPIKNAEDKALGLYQMLYGGPKTHGLLSLAKGYDGQESGITTIKTSTFINSRK